MPSILDWEPGKLVQALVFGRYKTGKTWGALTFPRPNVMDFDRGIATARNPEFVKKHGLKTDLIFEQFTDKFDKRGVPTTHDAFDAACVYFDKWMGVGYRDKFDTWVVDSGTTLSRASKYKAIILLGGSDAVAQFGQKSGTHAAAKKHGLIIPKVQDYGAERSMMEQFVGMVCDSGKHVLFLCHMKELSDKAGNLTDIVPLLTGQSVEVVPIMFDEVWITRTKPVGMEREYYLQTKPDGLRNCGSRYGLPEGTAFEWNAIETALGKIRAEQLKQAAEAKEKKQ